MTDGASLISAETLRRLEARVAAGRLPQVVVLPSQLRSGKSHYSELDLEAVKVARAAGVEAEFLDDPDDRRFLGEYAADVIIGFAIAIAEQLTVDGVVAVARYLRAQLASLRTRSLIEDHNEPRVRIAVQQVEVRSASAAVSIRGLEVEAIGEAAITQLVGRIADPQTAAQAIGELSLPPEDA